MQLLLRKTGHHFHTSAEMEIVRQIKEKLCFIALNPLKEEKEATGAKEEGFVLPDGHTVKARIIIKAYILVGSGTI